VNDKFSLSSLKDLNAFGKLNEFSTATSNSESVLLLSCILMTPCQ